MIERDPWSGTGYMTVAETFERRGKVADSLAYWQQAIVIDQTNPTPRLRKAQALIALGRAAEGEQAVARHHLTEVARRVERRRLPSAGAGAPTEVGYTLMSAD